MRFLGNDCRASEVGLEQLERKLLDEIGKTNIPVVSSLAVFWDCLSHLILVQCRPEERYECWPTKNVWSSGLLDSHVTPSNANKK